ncbi:hypothetical protein GCM10011490_13360 [Pseudoclavibacter endophyticus]|uniref:sensor histidine kinase n=1 Tax=Pseudoclavibacter endophyticus TaxID=1778590 RepID=UPI0016630075|nr:histidine kinase [Pseudoclavibacter endophyticus]GGA64038.1 hypothetical protein GCM10011490_13360 [Pseudoclavibacter endophyticus]
MTPTNADRPAQLPGAGPERGRRRAPRTDADGADRPGRFGRLIDAVIEREADRPHWIVWVAASIAAVVIICVGVPVHLVVYEITGPAIAIATILSILQGATLVLLFVMPRLATALHVGSTLGMALVTVPAFTWAGAAAGLPWPLSVVSLIAFMLLLVGLAARRRPVLAMWASLGVLLPLSAFAIALAFAGMAPGSSLPMLAVAAGLVTVVNVLATVVAQLVTARKDVRTARYETELADERRRGALERARIAREMHDVVAHSMSIVHMRATSARYRYEGIPDDVVVELDGIAEQARAALREMRGLLSVLRDEGEQLDAPQPGLGDLPALFEATRAAGVHVNVSVPDSLPQPPAAVQLALFRVTQESLSNVARHAGGAGAQVRLEAVGDTLVLSVRNDPPPGRSDPGPAPAPGATIIAGGGYGIRGMIERMTSVGGTLEHGPTADGGYAVLARAPFVAEPRA